jgi:hypothetical protein
MLIRAVAIAMAIATVGFAFVTAGSAEVRIGKNVRIGGHDVSNQTETSQRTKVAAGARIAMARARKCVTCSANHGKAFFLRKALKAATLVPGFLQSMPTSSRQTTPE